MGMRLVLNALAILPALAAAQNAVTLRFAPPVGKPYTYEMKVDAGTRNVLTMRMTMTATKASGGTSTVVTTFGNMTSMGRPAPAAQLAQIRKMRVVTVQNANGKVLSSNVDNPIPGLPNPSSGASVAYPARPIRIGESWSGEVKSSAGNYKTTYKLLSVGSYKGVRAAQIEARAKSPRPDVKISPIKYWVEAATGMPLNFDFSAEAQGQKIRTRMSKV